MSVQLIRIRDVWNHGFINKRPFSLLYDDFVVFSEVYTRVYKEPVWFYGVGNYMWLRCPVKHFICATIERCVDFAHGPGWRWHIVTR